MDRLGRTLVFKGLTRSGMADHTWSRIMDGNGKPVVAPGLPRAIEEIEPDGPRDAKELWLLARTYSRLRHRTSPRKYPEERSRFDALKIHCIRLALARDRGRFLVFVDPGARHLWLIYHRVERTLLHLPVEIDLSPPRDEQDTGASSDEAARAHVAIPCGVS